MAITKITRDALSWMAPASTAIPMRPAHAHRQVTEHRHRHHRMVVTKDRNHHWCNRVGGNDASTDSGRNEFQTLTVAAGLLQDQGDSTATNGGTWLVSFAMTIANPRHWR